MNIEQAIHQKTFKNEFQKVSINILFTASWLSKFQMATLKPFNISWQQFNILRILRGAHPEPLTIKLLTERMIDQMSNASRLVEKLKQKGLVDRKSCPEDRRRVDISITAAGLKIVNEASNVLEQQINTKLASLSKEEALQLNALLDKLRA